MSKPLTYRGESVDELEKSFRDAVDDYLTMSEKLGRAPQKPISRSPFATQ